MMWLRLGDNELVNMEYVVSIKKGLNNSIEMHLSGNTQVKNIPFPNKESRDIAFERIVDNMVKLRLAME